MIARKYFELRLEETDVVRNNRSQEHSNEFREHAQLKRRDLASFENVEVLLLDDSEELDLELVDDVLFEGPPRKVLPMMRRCEHFLAEHEAAVLGHGIWMLSLNLR